MTHSIPRAMTERARRIAVVGAGGTGSAVIPSLARLHHAMLELGHPGGIDCVVYDDDTVSESNVGRQGFLWSGDAYVGRKAEWPVWTPPKEMIARQPEAAKYASGMPGGLDNPLGARTLYLYQNGAYTLYTIYSTSIPETIGTNLTSGCTGLLSQDMIDLYSRTPVKTKVLVLPA